MDTDAHAAAMTDAQPLSPDPNIVKPTTETANVRPADALTPPTSEENNHEVKVENEDSELSDLDMSDEDEEVEPDHYWDGGRIPVFKPTMDQFRSFKKYVKKIDRYGMKSGIVKVIPPQEWRDSLVALDEMVKRIKIKNPITQEFVGTFGTYTQQNVEKQRSYNLPEWKALTESTQHQPPAKRGERRRNQEKVVRSGGNARSRGQAAELAKEELSSSSSLGVGSKSARSKRGPAAQLKNEATEEDVPIDTKAGVRGATRGGRRGRGGRQSGAAGQTRSVTSRRLNNTAEAADWIDEESFKGFNYRLDGLDEYTPERCAELETQYWKTMAFNQPMYAADMPGSLFDDSTSSWNVAKLENLLDVLGTKVPGVNTAYLYLGMWKATFAWHLEDVDLYSINYIHFGAPKQWYSISQEDARRFEAAMKHVWPVDSKNCDQFLRHKTYLISPDVLQKQYNVKVNKLVHYEGEFVITYPYGYHSGYNLGYNCAESVNFATESWLEFGRIARKCNCEADNVWVDVAEVERKLRGEPTPEYYEETDDDSGLDDDDGGKLLTPPASIKGGKSGSRKRKRGDDRKDAVKTKKKIRIRIKTSTHEPCAMCPNENAWEPLLDTDNGKKAHLSCALYTPETYVSKIDNRDIVCGVTNIDRARLELKCNFCRSKRGAVFQCGAKKCTRAFHATCALAAGVQIDRGPVPTFGEDGTEYFEEGYDFRCRFHRPKMQKHATVDVLENTKRVMSFARDVQPQDVVQAQLIGGDVFAGLVLENRHSEQTMLVTVLPDGDNVELDWKYLCVLDPHDSQRPKPSPHAIPMPEGMNKQSVSIENRQDGVPTQDEVFTSNPDFKWGDFRSVHIPPQGYFSGSYQPLSCRAELDKADQLYYYLPSCSTDSKACFTDKVGGTIPTPRGNFLERVNPRPAAITPQTLRPPFTTGFVPNAYQPRQIFSAATMQSVEKSSAPQRKTSPALSFKAQRNGHLARLAMSPASTPASAFTNSLATWQASSAPPRPFSPAHYYSYSMLPAAFPGDYSGFTQEVRRQSLVTQPFHAPPTGTPLAQQKQAPPSSRQSAAPTAQMIGLSTYTSGSTSRPSSATAQSHPLAPLTPTTSVASTRPLTSHSGAIEMHLAANGPSSSASSPRRASKDKPMDQWTPPSQRSTATQRQSSPALERRTSDRPSLQSHSTFDRALQCASRDGKGQTSEMRALLSGPGRPRKTSHSNFGQPYDTTPVWQVSPRAPTPSPMSDGHAFAFDDPPTAMQHSNPVEVYAAMNHAVSLTNDAMELDLGPMLPQMESALGLLITSEKTSRILCLHLQSQIGGTRERRRVGSLIARQVTSPLHHRVSDSTISTAASNAAEATFRPKQ